MKVCVIFPEGEFFAGALSAVKEALAGEEIVQISPRRIGDREPGKELTECELVIGEVTGRNAQVMYYSGWADALGKEVILAACYAEEFPFTMEREPIIYARDAGFLKEELVKRLGAMRKEEGEGSGAGADGREKFYSVFGDLMKKHGQEHRGPIEMENEKTFLLMEQDLDLALVQEMARRAREMGFRIKLL